MSDAPSSGDKVAYGLEESFKKLSIGRTLGFELVRRGELPSVKIGRRRVIPASALQAYLERLTAEQASREAS